MESKISIKFEPEDEKDCKCDITVKEELLSQSEDSFELKRESVELECNFDPNLYVDHEIKEEMVIGPTQFLKQTTETSKASVSSKTSYQCTLCSKTFKYKIGLNKHKHTEHNNNTTVISYFFHSNKKNKSTKSSKYIANDKNEFDSITCGVCFKHFSTLQSLRNHMKRCPMLRQKCTENNSPKSKSHDSVAVKNKVKETVVIKKGRLDNDVEISGQCDVNIKSKKEERNDSNFKKEEKHVHKKSDDKLIKNPDKTCPTCFKTFTFKNNLYRHMQLHTGMKKYSCNECSKSFNRKDYLDKHKSIKHSRKLLECKCGRKCYDKWRLKKHEDYFCKLNPKKREKTLFCDHCNKGFSHKFVLLEHLMRHANEKTLICDFCKKIFPQKYLLIRHILHHMTVPKVMYECDICGKKFIRSFSLKKHLISHTGKKPFSCKFCGRNFRSRWGCLSHEKQFCEVMNEMSNRR